MKNIMNYQKPILILIAILILLTGIVIVAVSRHEDMVTETLNNSGTTINEDTSRINKLDDYDDPLGYFPSEIDTSAEKVESVDNPCFQLEYEYFQKYHPESSLIVKAKIFSGNVTKSTTNSLTLPGTPEYYTKQYKAGVISEEVLNKKINDYNTNKQKIDEQINRWWQEYVALAKKYYQDSSILEKDITCFDTALKI